jgi:hypothetical protein
MVGKSEKKKGKDKGTFFFSFFVPNQSSKVVSMYFKKTPIHLR